MTEPIRVVVADDHPIVRAGIVALLSATDGIEVVGQAATGRAAVDLARAERPDLVLMDLRMPDPAASAGEQLDGSQATARIVEAQPATRVLILTTYETDDHILGAIEAGASGYLLKAAPPEEIVAGVRSVVAGQTALAPAIAATLVRRMREPQASAAPSLSARETQVLRLVADGLGNAQIATALFISEATVKTHLIHVFEKLEVSSRTRAVTRAQEWGML